MAKLTIVLQNGDQSGGRRLIQATVMTLAAAAESLQRAVGNGGSNLGCPFRLQRPMSQRQAARGELQAAEREQSLFARLS